MVILTMQQTNGYNYQQNKLHYTDYKHVYPKERKINWRNYNARYSKHFIIQHCCQ